jgi:hypothetical protein
MLMHPTSFYSWGTIKSPSAVMRHFLREDYGRTRAAKEASPAPVSSSAKPAAPNAIPKVGPSSSPSKLVERPATGTQFTREVSTAWGQLFYGITSREFRYYWSHFVTETLRDFSPLLVIILMFAGLSFASRKRDSRGGLLFAIVILYCYVLFSLIKIDPVPENMDVVERFYALPQLLICFLAVLWMPSERMERRGLAAVVLILVLQAGVSLAQNRASADFSKNTIVEDYACNLLQTVPVDKPSMLLAEDDTQYFALKYCQQVNGVHPETLVISAPLLFHSWYSQKVLERNPRFVFDAAKAQSSLHFSLEDDLLLPNIKQMTFLVSSHFNDTDRFRITYHALGRRIEEGQGELFDGSDRAKFTLRSTSEVVRSDPGEYSEYRRIFGEYAFYYLALGRSLVAKGDPSGAQKEYMKALEVVPYCISALENVCVIRHSVGEDASSCESEIRQFKASNFNYFPR